MMPLLHARRGARPTAAFLLPKSSPISTTSHLSAPKIAPKSSEEPKVKQNKVKKLDKTPKTSATKEEKQNRIQQLLVKAYDAPITKPPPASEEEMARRYQVGRNYVIGSFERHNEWNHDLANKIRMKKRAIKMLPKQGEIGDSTLMEGGDNNTSSQSTSVYGRWREEALSLNKDYGPPDWRHFPMLTPPIPGFDSSIYMEKDEDK